MDNKNGNVAANPNDNIVRNWLIGIGIALILIIAITFAIHHKDTVSPVVGSDMNSMATTTATSTTMGTDETGTMAMMTTTATGELLTIDAQAAGGSVTIASMTLKAKSWVAIKDSNGKILGAALFQAGDTSGMIPLLRDTVSGQTYQAMIYVDTTDKTFDWHQDQLVVSADNAPVSATFTAK